MRVASYASDQYRKNAVAERPREFKRTEPQASVKTTTFGFSLGKFGLDYSSQKTVLDPSLSRDVREQRQKAQAFDTEKHVENLRAKVGREGASYRDLSGDVIKENLPPKHRINAAMNAYSKAKSDILPPPGNMLAAVV